MQKALLVSLGYIGLNLLVHIMRNLIWGTQVSSHAEVVRLNLIIFYLDIALSIYVLIAVINRIKKYRALIAFVVLIILSMFVNALMLVSAYVLLASGYSEFLLIVFGLLNALLFVSYLLIALLMLIRKHWPVIVSVVLLLKLPNIVMMLPLVRKEFADFVYSVSGSYTLFAMYLSIYGLITTLVTALMLFVLYYDRNEVKEYQRVGERI